MSSISLASERRNVRTAATRADRALALYVEHFEEIAASFRDGVYRVPSGGEEGESFAVRLTPAPSCTCPDHEGGECEHVIAVRVVRKKTASCSSCGRRYRHRELKEITEDHESLTWFVGDQLCKGCDSSLGGIS